MFFRNFARVSLSRHMQPTLFTNYALFCLTYLTERPNTLARVRDISEHYGISQNHVVKVVHKLGQLGYLSSQKGYGGGIQLAKSPETIKLGHVVKQLEPSWTTPKNIPAKSRAAFMTQQDVINSHLMIAYEELINSLNKFTILDLVRSMKPLAEFINR